MAGGFGKKYESVKKNREFQFLFKKGECFVSPAFACYYRVNKLGVNRLGLVASKKIGNAVVRNRAKRVMREAFRLSEPAFSEKTDKRYDFILVSRAKTPLLKSGEVMSYLESLFGRIEKL